MKRGCHENCHLFNDVECGNTAFHLIFPAFLDEKGESRSQEQTSLAETGRCHDGWNALGGTIPDLVGTPAGNPEIFHGKNQPVSCRFPELHQSID